jgi:hypothetical protein
VFYIIEDKDKLDRLENLVRLGCYVDVITSNNNYHPKLSSIVAVYIRLLGSKQGYIIPINHSEGLNVDKERISTILSKANVLYTLNKKNLLYYFNIQSAIDLSLLYTMHYYERLEYTAESSKINYFYVKHKNIENINSAIPISLLFDNCENIYKQVCKHIDLELPEGFDFYNNTATNVFYLLEQGGLGIYYDAFNKLFTPKYPLANIRDNVAYTSYNLYNSTSRPTNAFNSVNFAAIPKSTEHRRCFHPQGDYFVEFDFDGYHLRLLCEQINYPLTEESAHKQLARLYFDRDEITEEEYAEAKQINFHAIYGKIPEKWAFLDIFDRIDKYIKELWTGYETDGRILAPISRKPFTKKLKDMNPQKLMNYVMQSLETSRNILILKEALRYLQNKKSNLVLYTYDALLFDFDKEDGKETLEDLQRILSENGKYPVKFKYSENLVL